MNECKHKVGGQSDWVGACPYCEIDALKPAADRYNKLKRIIGADMWELSTEYHYIMDGDTLDAEIDAHKFYGDE